MRKLLRAFLFFTRSERRGLLVWLALILLVIIGGEIYTCRQEQATLAPDALEAQQKALKEYQAFIASVRQQETEDKQRWRQVRPSSLREQAPVLTAFDPNTADSVTFRQLGLPGWMARNILRYREKGGKFRRPDDFRKIYGLTEEQYQTLSPYIRIAQTDSVRPRPSLFLAETRTDSLPKQVVEKYAPGTKVDLNRADTTELKKIPGIGSVYAARIVAYRRSIGGFCDVSQLKEVGGLPEGIERWFRISIPPQRNLKINRWGVERLCAHPYLNFYQARAIVEHRHKYGPLKSLSQLELYDVFAPSDIKKLEPYVDFSTFGSEGGQAQKK